VRSNCALTVHSVRNNVLKHVCQCPWQSPAVADRHPAVYSAACFQRPASSICRDSAVCAEFGFVDPDGTCCRGSLHLIDDSQVQPLTYGGAINALAWNPTKPQLLATASVGSVHIWTVASHQLVAQCCTGAANSLTALCFAPLGKHLVGGGRPTPSCGPPPPPFVWGLPRRNPPDTQTRHG
jgi:WD40 repeat protein